MSAGPVGLLGPDTARMPSRTVRPQLRLWLPPDGVLSPDELAFVSGAATTRLTRRGRLVVTLMVLIANRDSGPIILAASVDAAAPEIDHVTTVLVDQTLSEVAAAQLPSCRSPTPWRQDSAGQRPELLSKVHAGQSLLIPAMP